MVYIIDEVYCVRRTTVYVILYKKNSKYEVQVLKYFLEMFSTNQLYLHSLVVTTAGHIQLQYNITCFNKPE